MRNIDEIIETLNATELRDLAMEKKAEWTKEIKKIFKDVVKNFKNLDAHLADNALLDSVKENLNEALNRVTHSDVLENAMTKVADTKNQVFSILNIPTQTDIETLTRKVVVLEKKLKTISKHKSKC